MVRRVVIGGALTAATFLLAGLLIHSSVRDAAFVGDAAAQTPVAGKESPPAVVRDHPGFYAGEAGMNASERAGREIWYKATAGNDRFHTYTFPAARRRPDRLVPRAATARSATTGSAPGASSTIPAAARRAAKAVPAKVLEETYGFDWCPGDEELLKLRRARGLSRPGLRLQGCAGRCRAMCTSATKDQRQSACDLAFGTSTGALGFPQVPQSALRSRALDAAQRRRARTGRAVSASCRTIRPTAIPRCSHLADGSIEPPFLIGITLRLVPYRVRSAQSAGRSGAAGMGEHQGRGRQPVHAHLRDARSRECRRDRSSGRCSRTRAPARPTLPRCPTDQINNPGHDQRHHQHAAPADVRERSGHQVAQGRRMRGGCRRGECWCEPGRDGKCWRRTRRKPRPCITS